MTEKARSALLKVCVRNKQDEASEHLPKRVYIEVHERGKRIIARAKNTEKRAERGARAFLREFTYGK